MYLRIVQGLILYNIAHNGRATDETARTQNCDRLQQYDTVKGSLPVMSLALIMVDYKTFIVLIWRCEHNVYSLHENWAGIAQSV